MLEPDDRVRPEAIIAAVLPLLQATPAIVEAEAGALTAAQLSWRKDPSSWCVNEVVGHLIEAEERGFAGRIRAILAANEPDLVVWDQPAVAAARRDCERDGRALAVEFVELRTRNLQQLAGLQPDQLARTGRHPGIGRLSVRDVLVEWVYHDRDHVRQILDIVQALIWPEMGQAQKFYRVSVIALQF